MKYNVNIGDAWYGYTVNVSPMFVLAFNCEEGIKCLDGLFGNKASMIIVLSSAGSSSPLLISVMVMGDDFKRARFRLKSSDSLDEKRAILTSSF